MFKKIKKLLLPLLFVVISCVTVLAAWLIAEKHVYAWSYNPTPNCYKNFLNYGGADNHYYADVYYDELINGEELSTAQIKLERTKLQDGRWDKVSVNAKITLITPLGVMYEKNIGRDDTSVVLFDSSQINENGTYTVKASGSISAGVTISQNKSFTFVVDKTAPVGTLSGVTNRGFTQSNVQFTWEEVGATATLDNVSYSKNAVIKEEGAHTIKLTDIAGNVSTYMFTIDRTPPVGELHGVSNNGYTNSNVKLTWEESYVTATLNGANYINGSQISSEGQKNIILIDRAGNSTSYSFTIDKTAPILNDYVEYTNKNISCSVNDTYSSVSYYQYRHNGRTFKKSLLNGEDIFISMYGGGDNGIWEICATDICGNTSDWVQIKYVYRDTFGNSDIIYDTFFNPAFYKVTLSQKNYPSCCGTYEFAVYDSALRFAINKEWECRVITLNGGKEWNYVTASNESARTIYTDIGELDAVINKYARANISERSIMGENGTTLNNPTDENGITRVDALTEQISDLPKVLSKYSSERFMLAPSNHSFSVPTFIVDGNTTKLTIQFVSDGISLREGVRKSIEYGEPLKSVITEQGWYLVEESDKCGNVERYLIYIDMESPYLKANVTYGNGEIEEINFSEDYITENTEAMRYTKFDVKSLADNMDDFVMLHMDGRGLNSATYLSGDELPVLSYENGFYGVYSVSVYDRSLNIMEFVIYIAGEEPSLRYSSLSSDTSCTFTIQVNDNKNEIVDVKIYKLFYDGTRQELTEDSVGTQVCAENLIYKMTVGGKYVFEFSDLYGRIVRTNPLFFLKGLPVATLRGVRDGGVTKNDVKITYDLTNTAELSVLIEGEWVETDRFEMSQSAERNTLSILAGRDTSAIYKLLLYVTEDRNLFTEYTFEIDGIPPEIQIKTLKGGEVELETVTTEDFYVTWIESGYTVYYRKGNAVTDDVYIKDTLIKTAGTYKFTVLDAVRNELVFSITLDNSVDYSLGGSTYILLENDSYVTRGNFIFTLLEPWSLFNVESSNGLNVVNGQKIDTDGIYKISVLDLYGNSLSLTLIVDKLPPVPIITTESGKSVNSGARINEPFNITCEEDDANVTYSVGGGYKVYDGAMLSEPGSYAFTLTDWVGNSVEVRIVIDKMLSYNVNGTYVIDSSGRFISKNWLSITLKEEMSEFYIVDADGNDYEADKRMTLAGLYEVYMRDVGGNEITLQLIIDKTPPTIELLGVENGFAVGGVVTIKIFDYESAYYRRNGSEKISVTNGVVLVNEGVYAVTALDIVGNSAVVNFVIDKSVDVTPSRELFDGQIITGGISFTFNENVSATLSKDGKDKEYSRGNIIEVGDYSLLITDDFGNSAKYTWRIVAGCAKSYDLDILDFVVEVLRNGEVYDAVIDDNVLRLSEIGKYQLTFRKDKEIWTLELEVDNIAPSVLIENTGKSITISNPNKDGIVYTLYRDGRQISFEMKSTAELTAKGDYRLVCTDGVGNVTEYTFSLNYMGTVTIVLIAVVSVLILTTVLALLIIRLKHKKY